MSGTVPRRPRPQHALTLGTCIYHYRLDRRTFPPSPPSFPSASPRPRRNTPGAKTDVAPNVAPFLGPGFLDILPHRIILFPSNTSYPVHSYSKQQLDHIQQSIDLYMTFMTTLHTVFEFRDHFQVVISKENVKQIADGYSIPSFLPPSCMYMH